MLDRGHFNEKTGRLNREKRSDTLKNPQNLQDGGRKRWRENRKSPRAFSSYNMMREKNSLDRREKERSQRGKKRKNKGEFIEKNRIRSYLRKIREGNIPAYHTNKQSITPIYRPWESKIQKPSSSFTEKRKHSQCPLDKMTKRHRIKKGLHPGAPILVK